MKWWIATLALAVFLNTGVSVYKLTFDYNRSVFIENGVVNRFIEACAGKKI